MAIFAISSFNIQKQDLKIWIDFLTTISVLKLDIKRGLKQHCSIFLEKAMKKNLEK